MMRWSIRSVLVVSSLTAAGCASLGALPPHPEIKRPNDLAPGVDVSGAGESCWPNASWWTIYNDPQLNALMQRTMAGNPRLAAAQDRIATARGLAKMSVAATLPRVDAGADFDRTRFSHDTYIPQEINGHYLFDPVWNNSLGLSLSYHFDFWGADKAALEASLDQVRVSELEAQNARLQLEGAVLRSYAELSYAYELQDHEQAIRAAENQTLDLALRRLKAGLGTELEIQQAKNAAAATQAQIEEVTNRQDLLRHQLAALAGAGPGEGDDITRPALSINSPIGLPSHIPAELIGRRPDVQAERWRVESAGAQIAGAKAAFYPNVDLKATLGLVGIGFGQLLSGAAVNSSVGPAITLPIFDGGRLRAGLAIRTAQYDVAVQAYNASIVEALRQVADGISRLASLETLRQRRNETLGFAQRAHELAVIAFRAGLTDYNNVLSTEDALNRAQNLIAEVSFEQVTTFAALNEALGGGLSAVPDTAMQARR